MMKVSQLIFALILLPYISFVFANRGRKKNIYSDIWALESEGGEQVVKEICKKLGFKYLSPMGSLENAYLIQLQQVKKTRERRSLRLITKMLKKLKVSIHQSRVVSRPKRGYIEDPLLKLQWYLKNTGQTRRRCFRYRPEQWDINVEPVWKKNITGNGVLVSILDDGVDYRHTDLSKNYYPGASYDYNSRDRYPLPRYTLDRVNKHGTRCAGEIAGERGNGKCGVGVAYNAKFSGIRMLDGDVSDEIEGASLSYKRELVDIYSVSWGPDDDGKSFEGPGKYAKRALEEGINEGRQGRGSIFVWATGNGGSNGDFCSCDGYINSIYTIAIGAIDNCGRNPWYAEACAGTIAVTFSSGEKSGLFDKQIITTDLWNQCTKAHTGTSAAAPIAAGIFALVLEANNYVTWRDLQHLIVKTSTKIDSRDKDWQENGAGYHVNIKYGFGALNAEKMVDMARSTQWRTAAPQRKYDGPTIRPNLLISSTSITSSHNVGFASVLTYINKLEHVQVVITVGLNKVQTHNSGYRGHLSIFLTSPSGTKSELLRPRYRDRVRLSTPIVEWEFLTLFHWGENPTGKWTLTVTDSSGEAWYKKEKLTWSLKLYGT